MVKKREIKKATTKNLDEPLSDWIDQNGASINHLLYGHVTRRSAEVWHGTVRTPGWDEDPVLDAERAALRFLDLEAIL